MDSENLNRVPPIRSICEMRDKKRAVQSYRPLIMLRKIYLPDFLGFEASYFAKSSVFKTSPFILSSIGFSSPAIFT